MTLYGDHFTTSEDTSVAFGLFFATDLSVIDSTTLTCVTPGALGAGPVDVVVYTVNGFGVLSNGFTFADAPLPEIYSVDPDTGPVDGGTFVTITGANFTTSADTYVAFGLYFSMDVTVLSSTSLTCTTPSGSSGAVDVEVVNSNGSDILPNGFTYYDAPPPEIYSVDPDSGPKSGGTLVTIAGANFTTSGDTDVSFGLFSATDVNVITSTSLTCVTPSPLFSGSVDVYLQNSNGNDTLVNGFTYVDDPVPTVNDISPDYGHVLGGTTFLDVTITGTNFTTSPDTTVTFGGVEAGDVNVVDSTTITCTIAPHAEGLVAVRVTNSNGFAEEADAFTYLDRPVLYFIGGDPLPGELVAFEVHCPDRIDHGIMLVASDNLEDTYVGGGYDIWLNIGLDGYRTLYQSIVNDGPKLNAEGRRNFIVWFPTGLAGPVTRFQAIVGLPNPWDLDVSNYLDF